MSDHDEGPGATLIEIEAEIERREGQSALRNACEDVGMAFIICAVAGLLAFLVRLGWALGGSIL